MVEAVRLFAEGYRIEKIDRVMLDFGMPMGPLRLSDEVGLDIAEHVAKELQSRLAHLAPLNDTLDKMIANGWLGRKSGKGFYEYGSGAAKRSTRILGNCIPMNRRRSMREICVIGLSSRWSTRRPAPLKKK